MVHKAGHGVTRFGTQIFQIFQILQSTYVEHITGGAAARHRRRAKPRKTHPIEQTERFALTKRSLLSSAWQRSAQARANLQVFATSAPFFLDRYMVLELPRLPFGDMFKMCPNIVRICLNMPKSSPLSSVVLSGVFSKASARRWNPSPKVVGGGVSP